MCNRLDSIPACDGRTDWQADEQTGILRRHSPRYVYASRGKNYRILIKFCTHQQILNWMNVTWSNMKKLHWTDSEFARTYFLLKWRSTANLNVHIWSRDCHRFPNLLLCTKFHRNRMIFRWNVAIWRFSRFSIWRISAISNFMSPIIGSLKSPCRTSYRSPIETIPLKWLVFEKSRVFV